MKENRFKPGDNVLVKMPNASSITAIVIGNLAPGRYVEDIDVVECIHIKNGVPVTFIVPEVALEMAKSSEPFFIRKIN